MSNEQTNPNEEKKSLEQINKDLEANQLHEDEQGQIEGGFAAGTSKAIGKEEAETNIWCNTNC